MLLRLLREPCQLGYVTRDLDAAMARLRAIGGIGSFAVYEPELEVEAAGQRGTARIRVALANLGTMQVELIEPVDGAVGIYRDGAPDADPFLHHVAVLVRGGEAAWDAALADLAAAGHAPALTGEGGRAWGTLTRFAYVDARPLLGHHVELIWRSPGAQAAHDALPDQSA